LTRVDTNGSVPSGIAKFAASALGFLSTTIAIVCTPLSVVPMVIGTMAPFSAMSGAPMRISVLSVDPPAPSALTASPKPWCRRSSVPFLRKRSPRLDQPRRGQRERAPARFQQITPLGVHMPRSLKSGQSLPGCEHERSLEFKSRRNG